MLYTVYILYSASHKRIYIGYTSNLIERFRSHNVFGNKGYTVKFRPWEVIYCEYYQDKSQALLRERELKGGKGREWIHSRISSQYFAYGFISA